MLGNEELVAWFQHVRLPECGRSIIHQVRSSDPARRVGGGRRNVSGRYPSKKMGVTIQFESHRVELARIYELEHDSGVIEYWDQPPSFKLEYKSAQGKFVPIVRDGKNAKLKTSLCAGSKKAHIDIVAMMTFGVVLPERNMGGNSALLTAFARHGRLIGYTSATSSFLRIIYAMTAHRYRLSPGTGWSPTSRLDRAFH